ncbi:MAG: methyltransferase domain-containing protein [Thermomicrobiales bacterium]|nr:methyltransferase domain-containing protein [Thermomicrobiales bacterium]MCO5223100.1 methyltransferase domain-containing protein [Thermomicrobiales bacterium]
MSAWDESDVRTLAELYSLATTPARTSAIRAAGIVDGSHGVDLGCGSGVPLAQLAKTVGPDGAVTGIDNSSAQLELARERIDRDELDDRVTLIEADLTQPLPVPMGAFDWAWAENVLWPSLLGDDDRTLRALVRAVRPGGRFALLFGNFHRAFEVPGYPHLEHKIYLADGLRWFGQGAADPDRHFENAASWLRRVGLVDIQVSTHITELTQPLPVAARRHLELCFATLFGDELEPLAAQAGITPDEWALWRRLSVPSSPDYLLDRDDYRIVRISTLTTGMVSS